MSLALSPYLRRPKAPNVCNVILVKLTSHFSVYSVMNLLAEIYSQEEMVPKMYKVFKLEGKEIENGAGGCDVDGEENPYVLSTLAPRLWPFMRHSITSVRYSAIRTLVIFAISQILVKSLNII